MRSYKKNFVYVPRNPDESRDCTVRALSAASGMSYDDAHICMELAGRRRNHGAHTGGGLRVAEQLGFLKYKHIPLRPRKVMTGRCYEVSEVLPGLFSESELSTPSNRDGIWIRGQIIWYHDPGRRITLAMVLAKLDPGRYIMHSRNHAFAVINGIVHDNRPIAPNTVIEDVWKIESN